MQVIKFVTKDFKSPGNYEQLDYSGFGTPIEVDADPKDYGQCAKGIHVVPINEDVDFENVIFTDTMILLEVAEEDIVYCGKNGKMRVRKATPIRQVTKADKEWRTIRTTACNDSYYAYWYAREVDKKPTNKTRTAACNNPGCAYLYALHVDGRPKDETRTAICQLAGYASLCMSALYVDGRPMYAYLYAKDVDKKPTAETRTAACSDPEYAYLYAKEVDKKPTKETRTAACQDPEYAYLYALDVDKRPTDETRITARDNPGYAYLYARDVDKKPTDETRIAASKDTHWKEQYEQWEKALNS
jgi:hypothetical protein